MDFMEVSRVQVLFTIDEVNITSIFWRRAENECFAFSLSFCTI
jgi:hypothetical protein